MRLDGLAGYVVWALVFMAVALLLPNGRAQAYLDPGSGSFILQIVVAALAGGLLTLRVFWNRLRVRGRSSEAAAEPDGDAGAASDESPAE